ncbi:MAG: radical SAM protein, partial [Oscillospiraceae bacterium]|nr:radical SAM protein [Oscillospiraceae bacterium]
MMTILYTVGDKLYINLTNKCPCNCTFCIRQNGEGAYGSDSLWLDREPTVDEVIDELEKYDMSQF